MRFFRIIPCNWEVTNESKRHHRDCRVAEQDCQSTCPAIRAGLQRRMSEPQQAISNRRIAWRLQANDEGGLSRAALKRAAELAEDAETRVTAPRKHSTEGVKLVLFAETTKEP